MKSSARGGADKKRALALLDHPDPLLTIVLKGHLLAEERLNQLIRLFAPHPEHLAATTLRFHQKLGIVRALVPTAMADALVWELLEALNTVRNEMAHSLGQDRIESRAKALWMKYGPDSPYGPDPDGAANRVRQTVAYALGYLEGIARRYRHRQRRDRTRAPSSRPKKK